MEKLPDRLHPKTGKRPLLKLLPALFLLFLPGCDYGTRYIFSPGNDVLSNPGRVGLAFEDVWFDSPDGALLHGWYVPGDPDQPMVVFFHGNAANVTHRVDNILNLNRMGLPVFIFDYRGFGISEGRALKEDDLFQDARGALRWLRSQGWVPERMIYYGRSMGAAVALQAALEQPPAGVVLECAFTSLAEIAWETTPVIYALVGWWSIEARFDNIAKISRLHRPLLIVHGEGDQIIPWSMGKRLFEKASVPKTFLSVPGAGHSNAFEVGGDSYRMAWKNFIRKIKKL